MSQQGAAPPAATPPILLYNDECAVCRRIARWVQASLRATPALIVRPIGDDPLALAQLNPSLDIWDAYEVVHLIMPDGSMKTGGAAVAEVLRRLPATKWLAWLIDLHIARFRPGVLAVDAIYTILADVRPLLGCASCGSTNSFVRAIARVMAPVPHFPAGTRHQPERRSVI
jgi:predicted DCC family thiol-disulfide oxidoreductase YuxK